MNELHEAQVASALWLEYTSKKYRKAKDEGWNPYEIDYHRRRYEDARREWESLVEKL